MKAKLKEVSPTQKELHIEIPAEDVREIYQKVSQKYARAVTVPGFRKGLAPVDVVKLRFKDEISNEVLRELLPDRVSGAIEEHGLSPIGEPHIHLEDQENVKLNGSQAVELHVHVEVMPEIPAPKYKGIEATRRIRPVKEEELDQIIQERRQQGAAFVPVEGRKSKKGDTLIVDLEGTFVDKPEEEPIKADDLELTLGEEYVEKSFTENLVGLEEDDEKEFTVEYPEDFSSPGLAGQKVAYKAKVKSLGTVELPELDDDWAQGLEEGFKSMKDLRKKLRDDLEMMAKMEADNKVRDELLTKLIDSHELEVPNTLVEIQARNLLNNFAQDLQRQGMDLNKLEGDFIQMAYEQMRGQAERDVRGAMLLEKVAELEKIEISNDEVAEEIEKMAAYYRVTPEEIRASLTKQGGEGNIADRLRSRKSVEALVDKAKITDAEWVDEKQAAAEAAEEKPAKKKAGKAEKKEKSAETKEKKTRKKSE
jgi:trigger factor